jgi:hypothetical protein
MVELVEMIDVNVVGDLKGNFVKIVRTGFVYLFLACSANAHFPHNVIVCTAG